MKYIPKLFSTPMVQAILENRKTKTRRTDGLELVNDTPDKFKYISNSYESDIPHEAIKYDDRIYYLFNTHWSNSISFVVRCPYKNGDILWVKETHYAFGDWQKNGLTKTGKQKWKFVRQRSIPVRFFDNKPEAVESTKFRGLGWYKRSSLFLEKSDCRILLQVTNVKVEKLNNISEEDAICEGIGFKDYPGGRFYETYPEEGIYDETSPLFSFIKLWESINGIGSWNVNDWVWVIGFNRITKPEKFC